MEQLFLLSFGLILATVIVSISGLPSSELSFRKNNSSASVSFSVFATELSGCELLTKCDTSVTIMCSSISSDWKICNQTKVLRNNNNPVWPDVFSYQHEPGTRQRLRMDLKEHSFLGSKLIASFPVILDDYAESTEEFIKNYIPSNTGIFWIRRRMIR